ncbi:MAG TPA: O-antigen ligase family protein [Solirubrobacterales bacterium]|nr:O-antigen ligase family protein [Solirubrobacterales bacterium]
MITRPLGGRDIAIAGFFAALITGFLAATHPLLALAAFFAVVFLTWMISRPELVLLAMIAALPWEAMLHYPTATLSTVKLFGLALVGAYVLQAASRETKIRTSPVIGIAIVFAFVVGLSLIASAEPSAGLEKTFRYSFFVLFLFLVAQLVSDRETGKRLLQVYVASAALASLSGLISFLSGAEARASGPIEDPNDFGYLMATAVPFAIYLYREDRRLRFLWGASLILLLAATAGTLSRGAAVGLGALLLWALFTGRVSPKAMVTAVAGIFLAAIVALALWSPLISDRLQEKERIAEKNVESREAFWSAATQMWMSSPVLGIGPDRFGIEAPEYVRSNPIALQDPVVHNAYLEILAEDGPIALALFLAMMGAAWSVMTRAEREARRRGDDEAARFAAAVKGSLLVAAVSAIFLSEQVTAPIWLACALAASGALPRPQPAAALSAAPRGELARATA